MKRCLVIIFFVTLHSGIVYSQYKINNLYFDKNGIDRIDSKGKQGTWLYFNSDSTDVVIENFINDTLDGNYERYYYKSGKISQKGFCKNGLFDGTFIFYWENGTKQEIRNYKKGIPNGEVMRFDSTGKLIAHVNYMMGKVDSTTGEDLFMRDSQHNNNRVNNTNNEIDTVKTTYPGIVLNREYTIYKNDSLIQRIRFYKNGMSAIVLNYKNGIPNGEVMRFDSAGKLTAHYNYIRGKVDTTMKGAFIEGGKWIDTTEIRYNKRVDTVKTVYPGNYYYNKIYSIYKNDTLAQRISFYKNVINIVDFYEMNLIIKSVIYSSKKPYNIEKVFYYKNEKLSKTELFNKYGKLIKTY